MLIAILAALAAAGGGGGLWYWLKKRKPPQTHTVTLTWKAGADGPGVYNVYRNGVKLTPSPIVALTYADKNVQSGVTYKYTVTELIKGTESPMSNTQTVTIN